jgi:subtilisin family serine protease
MSDLLEFFEELLYQSMGSVRFTQNSPILPDVWLRYAKEPGRPHDLLLTPHTDSTPVVLAKHLRERLKKHREKNDDSKVLKDRDKSLRPDGAQIAFNETTVVARLWFLEVIQVALPLTKWWRKYLLHGEGEDYANKFKTDSEGFRAALAQALRATSRLEMMKDDSISTMETLGVPPNLLWLARVVGMLALIEAEYWAARNGQSGTKKEESGGLYADAESCRKLADDGDRVVDALYHVLEGVLSIGKAPICLWSINRNRTTEASVHRSARTVKADAVQTVFDVRGKNIRWAVIDSGIDARHLAFRKRDEENGAPLGPMKGRSKATLEFKLGEPTLAEENPKSSYGKGAFVKNPRSRRWDNQTRVVATYDFTKMRKLLSADPDSLEGVPEEILQRASTLGLKSDLKKALKFGRMIDWELLKPLLEIKHDSDYQPPKHHHGTHVAGIIGADWREGEHALSPKDARCGVAPEIELYDLRALGPDGGGDEFSILAAMQFVRSLNSHRNLMAIHGVNLSFSIRHEVSNFACGRTPVCEEAERLVGSGVVVVTAAGNRGRARFMTSNNVFEEGYRDVSITDPGNAGAVITVGATHRHEPHNYGVSYFSSRGPTGDGRLKPDLVAPGEKIYSTVPNDGERELDGTSMAAPHVSGAAALLLERNFELVGQPNKIKSILCESATDLGREPYYQGTGMLDILRALQSV